MQRKIIWPVVLDQSFNFYGEGVFHTKQTKIWPSLVKLVQWFQRRRFLKKFTHGLRMPSDGNSSHGL
jgi:hypothetical protein